MNASQPKSHSLAESQFSPIKKMNTPEERRALVMNLAGLMEEQEKSRVPQIFVREIKRVSKLLKRLYKEAEIRYKVDKSVDGLAGSV